MLDQLKKQIIFTATDEQLTCPGPGCYLKLWGTAVSLKHLTRRGWITALECFMRDTDILGIKVLCPSGQAFEFEYIFNLFADEEGRWISDFLRSDDSGCRPKQMSRKLDRLRLIDAFLQSTVSQYSQIRDIERCSLTHFPLGW